MSEGDSAGASLEALARQARDGDERAFRALVRHVHPRIFRWALLRTGDPDDAEDVAQDVLIRLHRGLGAFAGRGSFAGWLFRVTVNRAVTFLRRRSRRNTVPLDRVAEVASGGSPDTAGDVVELATRLLRDLPARQREMFDLVDLQALSPAEAAEWMGVEPSTARVHLLRARRKMRQWILETSDCDV